jgi:hypothetical protein
VKRTGDRLKSGRRRWKPPARSFDVALAATLHDTTGALADDVRRFLPALQALYRNVAVATSPPTSPRIVELLQASGAWAGTPSTNERGPLYRLSLRGAVAGGAGRVHYLDFDRALHWMRRSPREYAATLRLAARLPLLLVGRTADAHRSHHLPLYATEVLANRLMAGRAGVSGRLDLLVPSFVLSAADTRRLLRRSRSRDVEIYGELAVLVLGLADQIAYLECWGLDWETPDRHRRAVRRAGLAAWRRRQETPAEWALRTELAAEIVRAFERVLKRAPARPSVRRLTPRAR